MRTWTTAVAIGCLLASSPSSGLDSTLRLTQYRHTAWRVQDGSFAAAPNAVAQTTDGYIWIGTGAGLVKYDGVRFAPWTAPGQQTPFSAVGPRVSISTTSATSPTRAQDIVGSGFG